MPFLKQKILIFGKDKQSSPKLSLKSQWELDSFIFLWSLPRGLEGCCHPILKRLKNNSHLVTDQITNFCLEVSELFAGQISGTKHFEFETSTVTCRLRARLIRGIDSSIYFTIEVLPQTS